MQGSCCAPSAPRDPSRTAEPAPAIPASPSTDETGMVRIPAGEFLMGTDGPEAWPGDGEGPVRPVQVDSFLIDSTAVTNSQFAKFVEATGFRTEAERFGWSFVHYSLLTKQQRKAFSHYRVAGLEWWYRVDRSFWNNPLGTGQKSDPAHPVTHVSWNDADAYAAWSGKRLPTEAEWEYASRGGLQGKLYPWGDDLTPGGKHLCNIWQGTFPEKNTREDGHLGTAPADAFPPNAYGLHNMTGNVWEWCNDWFCTNPASLGPRPYGPPVGDRKVIRGGSYLCHASYCNRYRCAARTSNTPDSSTGHIGFRCVRS